MNKREDTNRSLTEQLAEEFPGIDEGSNADEASAEIRRTVATLRVTTRREALMLARRVFKKLPEDSPLRPDLMKVIEHLYDGPDELLRGSE